ncbi:MAG TPA: phytanoyl-CoA dioxygenase family protein [Tepidisphaeraceae bacterium]|jgi:ectoine hydroxylase-related dioxygenase (phytanoyl-CoA dioxygenase family)
MEFTPLGPEQRRQFEEEGFLILRGVLDKQLLETLIAAGDRLLASDRQENRQREPDGLYDGFRNCIAMDDAFIPLLTHAGTLPLIVQLLGPHIHLVTSHLIYKHPDPPGTDPAIKPQGWHRDIAGTPEDLGHAHVPRMEMKCAFYLTDLSEPNSGATLFAPGSNHFKEAMEIPPGKVGPANAFEPRLRPGDAVFFENRTYHAVSPNLSARTRKVVMLGYGYQWLKPFDYTIADPALAGKVDDIGKQLLGALRDPQGRFLYSGLDWPLRNWCKTHGVVYRPPQ